MRRLTKGVLAATGLMLATSTYRAPQELTIFWAEWDPANYLQELVNEYEAETGVKVTVETRRGRTSRPRPSPNSTPRAAPTTWSSATRSGSAPLRSRPLCRPHRLLQQAQAAEVDGSGDREVLRRISVGQFGKYWSIPAEGDAVGWSYRKDWFEDPKEMEAFKAKYGYDLAPPKDWKALRDIAEFFHRPDEKRYGIAIYTDNSYDALVMGVENAIFSFGGELGDYANYKVDGIINSDKNDRRARGLQGALQVHASGLGQDLLRREQPGDHRRPGGDEHELLRLLPGAGERGDQPERQEHRLLRQPGRPGRRPVRGARRAGHLGRLLLGEPGRGDEVPEWFIKDETQKKWAELGGYTAAPRCSRAEFQNATPYNKAFYETMFKVKDFWATCRNMPSC
jgi:multiple sugar transport system substrate-binding protein